MTNREELRAWVKERMAKINADPQWGAQAWSTVFLCGFDILNRIGLRDPSLSWEEYLVVLRRQAQPAWYQYGPTYLERFFHPEDPKWKCWAEVEFGSPYRR